MSSSVIDDLVKIEKNHIAFGGDKYFRRSAHKIDLCSHGRKSTSAVVPNYMQVTARIASQHMETLPIRTSGLIEVDWTEVSQKELNLEFTPKFFGFDTEIAQEFDQTLAEQLNLKLMCFWINAGPLKKCLNNKAHAVRNAMAAEGKDARIVSSILVAMDIKLAEHFTTQSTTSLTLSDMGNKIVGITAGSGLVGSKTIRLAQGTTFGYGLHKVKGWRNKKTEIKQLEDDWLSFG